MLALTAKDQTVCPCTNHISLVWIVLLLKEAQSMLLFFLSATVFVAAVMLPAYMALC